MGGVQPLPPRSGERPDNGRHRRPRLGALRRGALWRARRGQEPQPSGEPLGDDGRGRRLPAPRSAARQLHAPGVDEGLHDRPEDGPRRTERDVDCRLHVAGLGGREARGQRRGSRDRSAIRGDRDDLSGDGASPYRDHPELRRHPEAAARSAARHRGHAGSGRSTRRLRIDLDRKSLSDRRRQHQRRQAGLPGNGPPPRGDRGSGGQDRGLRGRIRPRDRRHHQRRDALGRQRFSRGRLRLLQLARDAGRRQVTDQNILAAEQTSIDRLDAGLALGGYILKDRLWFFGSYDRIGQTTDRIPQQGPAAGGTYPFDSRSNVYSGKLTWNAGASTSVVTTIFGDPEERTGATGGAPATGNLQSTDPLTYTATRNLGGTSYAGRLNQIFGPSVILALQYSGHEDGFRTSIAPESNFPRVTDATVPGLRVFSGGFGNINGPIQNQSSRRDTASASLTSYLGNHELKLGGEYERDETAATTLRSGAATLSIQPCKANPANPVSVDRCAARGGMGVPYVNFRGENVTGGVFFVHGYQTDSQGNPVTKIFGKTPIKAYSAYLQDNWRLSPRLTINAGLRWEREQIANWKGEDRVDLNSQWAPRAGVVWDFVGDGTSKAFTSYGRFYYRYPTDLNARAFGRSDFFNASTVNYDRNSLRDDPLAPRRSFSFSAPAGDEPVDRNLKGMYQDEFTIGVEKALEPTFVVGLKGHYQRLGSAIEDRCDLDYNSPLTGFNFCGIINPGSSEPIASGKLPCFNGNDRPDNAVLYPGPADDALCNENGGPAVPRASRLYRGIELTARKSVADRLWIQAWYVYSSLRGNYDGAASLRSGQTDPGINSDFDYWQFDRSNSSGKLYLDRPHAFQLSATYLAPFGFVAGFSGFVRSGPPRNQLLFLSESYPGDLYGVRRGFFGRAATQYEINVAVGYQLRLGPVSITPRLFVFNLLNRQGETRIEDDFNPNGDFDANGNDIQHVNFGKILERQEPRLIRVAVRISF